MSACHEKLRREYAGMAFILKNVEI